jgi:hypothetical protein
LNKLTDTYRYFSIWILAAVFVNLLFPSVMEAAQLFCDDTSSSSFPVQSAGIHTAPSCWMDLGADTAQTNISHDSCSQVQLCEEAIKTGLSETLITHHQKLHDSEALLAGSKFNTSVKSAVRKVSNLSQNDILRVREIYLLNSVFLN